MLLGNHHKRSILDRNESAITSNPSHQHFLRRESMKTKLFIAILIVTASVTQGAILDIYADDTIQNGDVYDTVNIYDSLDIPPVQTTVDMTGGEIAGCHLYDTAILNYWDGEIVYFVTHDNSTAEVHSDYDYSFTLEDESKIFLHNGGSNFQVLIVL